MTPNIQQLQRHGVNVPDLGLETEASIGGKTQKYCPSSTSSQINTMGDKNFSVCNSNQHNFSNRCTSLNGSGNKSYENNSINRQSLISKALNPFTFLLVATPIASIHPVIQMIIFISILVSASPLYFMLMALSTDGIYRHSSSSESSRQGQGEILQVSSNATNIHQYTTNKHRQTHIQ